MLRTDHDTASARDAFLLVGLVGFPHSDGSDRAHFHTSMAGCTFSPTPFWMQRNRLGITIRAISLYHQSATADIFGIWSRSSLLFEAKSWSCSISSALGLPSAILGNMECWAMTAAAESNLKPWDSTRSFSSMSVSSL